MFCFVHIEKAGGITLHNSLHRSFFGYVSPSPDNKFGRHFDAQHVAELRRILPCKLTGIGGHQVSSVAGYEDLAPGFEVVYFTFLRNPISRFVSHYNWRSAVQGKQVSFEEFATDEYFHNFQCYRVSRQRKGEDAIKELNGKFAFAGLLERYDESMLALQKIIPGFDPLYEKSNVKDYGAASLTVSQLTLEQRALAEAANQEDEKLYQHVASRFDADMEAIGVRDEDVEALKRACQKFSFGMNLKRKISNRLLADIIQPRIKARLASSDVAI